MMIETRYTALKHVISLVLVTALLNACGAAAAPCRVASAGIKIIPVVGSAAATPTDACAAAIDP